MSFIEIKVVIGCRLDLGCLAYIFTPLRFVLHKGAVHVLRGVFRVYHRLIQGLAIVSGGNGGSVVNNAPEAARRKGGLLQVLMSVAARLPLIRPAR